MEYAFELALCAELEAATDWIVARQLGGTVAEPGRRVVDVVGVEPGPSFDERARITSETIPPTAVEADVGAGRAREPSEVFDTHPETRAEAIERAVDCGFFTVERRGGRERVRQTTRYPDDWFGELVAIENKPDLGTPGALERQLRVDTRLALFDRAVLATASHVTGAHRNRIPDAVGIWRFDPDTGERTVVREATRLPVGEPGVEIRAEHAERTDVAVVDPAAKRRQRRRVAERAYGKGWRPEPPACDRCEPTPDGRPHCGHFDRVVEPNRECGADCPGFVAADPPELNRDAIRARRTPWRRDPDGTATRQSGLDRFG